MKKVAFLKYKSLYIQFTIQRYFSAYCLLVLRRCVLLTPTSSEAKKWLQ